MLLQSSSSYAHLRSAAGGKFSCGFLSKSTSLSDSPPLPVFQASWADRSGVLWFVSWLWFATDWQAELINLEISLWVVSGALCCLSSSLCLDMPWGICTSRSFLNIPLQMLHLLSSPFCLAASNLVVLITLSRSLTMWSVPNTDYSPPSLVCLGVFWVFDTWNFWVFDTCSLSMQCFRVVALTLLHAVFLSCRPFFHGYSWVFPHCQWPFPKVTTVQVK